MFRPWTRPAVVAAAVALAYVAAPWAPGEPSAHAAPKKKKKKGGTKPKKKKKPKAETPIDVGDIDEPAASESPTGTNTGASASAGGSAGGEADDDGDDAPDGQDGPGPAPRERPFSAELLLGYGISSVGCGAQGCNPYGFGLGVRGGYTLPMGIWLGASLGYQVGHSTGVRQAPNPFDTVYTGNVFYVGPEVGYELTVGPIGLRPFLGLGVAAYTQSIKDALGPDEGVERGGGGARLLVWPGVLATYAFGPQWYAGLDLRGFLMADGASAFSFFAVGGARFGL